MKTIEFTMTGVAPLMMHSERLANPRDALTRELKALTAKNRGKNKTDELSQEIAELEWLGGLYVNAANVPALPAELILAVGRDGARKSKSGRQFEAGVFAEATHFALIYDGPTDPAELVKDERFFDYRSVGVNGSKVMRARPRFDKWECQIVLNCDPEIIEPSSVLQAYQTAGSLCGMGEKRPQFGRFTIRV